jgi:2-dehydropantoate 2-reductase
MNPRDGGFADLVLFCVKPYDTETAAERLRPTIGPETVILPVQNGIDSAERIGRVVGSGHVIGGTAGVSSVLEAPGIIDHRSGPDEIRLGELDGQPSARVERIAEVLRRAGIKAEIRLDIRVALWEKLRALRKRLGLTQRALAERVGVHPNSIARQERGEVGIGEPLARLVRLLAETGPETRPKRKGRRG